jgi:hypothetical protein
MADPNVLNITDGLLALTVVDEAAVGYAATWQSPGGDTALVAALADYTDGDSFSCQITSGRITTSKNVTRRDRAATFCAPATSTPSPGSSTYALDFAFFQDAHIRDGLSSFLWENDTLEAYFLLAGDAGTTPPRAIGRCYIAAGSFLGEPRADLTDSVSLDIVRKPDVVFGTTGSTRLITGTGTVTNSA